jgi:GT2 family glycosyltransferase
MRLVADFKKISAIIVTYVGPLRMHLPILEGVLNSLIQQTLPPEEIIVVDDGSPPPFCDQVRDLVRQYRGTYIRLDKQHKENRSCACFNLGLSIATTPVSFIMFDDCILLQGGLAKIAKVHETFENVSVVPMYFHVDNPEIVKMFGEAGMDHVPLEEGWWRHASSRFSHPEMLDKSYDIGAGISSVSEEQYTSLGWCWGPQSLDVGNTFLFDNRLEGWGYDDYDFGKVLELNGVKMIVPRDVLVGHVDAYSGTKLQGTQRSTSHSYSYLQGKWRDQESSPSALKGRVYGR